VVLHVPVCTYAHVREAKMHIAERVKKKMGPSGTGTTPGRAAPRRTSERRKPGSAFKEKRTSGLLRPFLGLRKG
jgi:hypothetical protein